MMHNSQKEALQKCVRRLEECVPYLPIGLRTFVFENIREAQAALSTPPRYCDIMSLESAKKLWFVKEIIPRLDGDLPLGKEIPFEEWFVSQSEQGAEGEAK